MARRRPAAIAAPARAPSGISSRILAGILILALLCIIVLAGAAGFFTFRIVTEHNDAENVTPASFLLINYESLSFVDRSGGEHEGWLLRGLKGAPAIILCPAYDSNRSELLSLGTVLQENHFNVYAFSFHGPKTKQSISDLGVQQADDLQAAIQMLTKQRDINPHRLGLYGATTGGYAVLTTAFQSPLVKAFVVDSIYERPAQMFDAQLDQLLGGPSGAFRTMADVEFRLMNWGSKTPPIRENLAKLQNIPKFFISSRDSPLLAKITEDLYALAPQPKRLWILEHSYTAQASGTDKKEYENEVLTFFSQSLPLRAD
jgi:hypothetical protein